MCFYILLVVANNGQRLMFSQLGGEDIDYGISSLNWSVKTPTME
jgi:hypothetical protein